MAGLDLELVRHALRVARQHGFAEVEVETAAGAFRAELDPVAEVKKPNVPQSESSATVEDDSGAATVKSTMVGYVKMAAPPVGVGDTVRAEDVVAVVEALGLANDVEAGRDGEILEIHFRDGDAVQFGQALVTIKVNS